MEIQGKVIAVLPERSGISARGEWKSQTYVIETQEQYPKKMAFDVFGADRIANFGIQFGEVINVSFDIDAHEYQGRYFNQIRAWNVVRQAQQAPVQGGGFSGNVQPGAQAAQQAMASSANAAGVANPTNPQNLFPPAQPQQPQSAAPSSDQFLQNRHQSRQCLQQPCKVLWYKAVIPDNRCQYPGAKEPDRQNPADTCPRNWF